MLVENVQNCLVPAFRTWKGCQPSSGQGCCQLPCVLRPDDNRHVNATQKIQIIHPVTKPGSQHVVERPVIMACQQADTFGFASVSGDVMKATSASPVFAAALDRCEQFIARRVENLERLVVFSDFCQPGLFAG